MKAACRDLGRMEYEACWQLQRCLFEELLARKGGAISANTCRKAENRITQSEPLLAENGTAAQYESAANRHPAEETRTEKAGNQNPAEETRRQTAAQAAGTEKMTGTDYRAEHDPAQKAGTEYTTATQRAGTEYAAEDDPAQEPEAPEAGTIGTVLLVEHPPVYTLGKSGRAENLLVAKEALEAMGAQFFHIDRGGDITFHGPGQLVCYPILDLERIGLSLRAYVDALEEAVIRTVAGYGIAAGRMKGASGVWIEEKGCPPRKICAIGVRASRYVTMHGFALNVSTDLGWFARINPCGFTDRGVTSLACETGRETAMAAVKERIVRHLSETLGVRIESERERR